MLGAQLQAIRERLDTALETAYVMESFALQHTALDGQILLAEVERQRAENAALRDALKRKGERV